MAFTTTIDADALRALIGKPGTVLLDCRFDLAAPEAGRQAYRRGHIPTARYLDLNRDLSAPVSRDSGRHPLPDPRRLAATLERRGLTREAQAIAYDDSNAAFAARAWWLLRWIGHRNAAVLDGGLAAWLDAGGTLQSGDPMPERGGASSDDTGAPRGVGAPRDVGAPRGAGSAAGRDGSQAARDVVVTTRQLIEALEDPRRKLIDARAPERFAGAVEPIDAVAGHIPGAVNHPFDANLRGDGRFLPREELARRWRERLGGTSPADAIVMCGSGVTACHNLLALELAGLGGAKLYAGSWSEWIRDPARPVARG